VVPLGGGIGIFVTLILVIITSLVIVKYLVLPGRLSFLSEPVTVHATGFMQKAWQLIWLVVAVSLLFVVGLIDDIKHLGPGVKLFFQFAAALITTTLAQTRVEFFIHNTIVTSILSAVWIVFVINAFNFLDNMDGLSAGIAIITATCLVTSSILSGQVFVSALAIVFIATMAGFLVFNFPPAKIFMGDAGSMIVGFFVAVLTLRTTYYHQAQSGQWYPVLLPIVAMAVPLYDFTSVTFLRICQGKSPFVGDTQHFSHRLKRRGLSDTQTVLTLYLATLCTALGATFLYQVDLAGAILVLVQTFMILIIIAIFESTSRTPNQRSDETLSNE
jgi:UDP-GlcNAc:undecaprenyl-phosphate GlcNAc-1-phosphate transferase